MGIPVLQELHQEVRRLYIAGSDVAAGDLRLNRLLPQLRKLGEGAPVFGRLAEATARLTESDAESSSARLLELGALLHAVLYTQGRTEPAEPSAPFQPEGESVVTDLPYRRLGPLIEALTQRGPGRLDVIRQAAEEGMFHDLRTLIPAVSTLEDTFAEIPEFIAEHVIPQIGSPALPILRRQFNAEGGRADARRLLLIDRLSGGPDRDWLARLADTGSAEVRAAAISRLGVFDEMEPKLLELAGDKKKEIRRAALLALAERGTEPAFAALLAALDGKDEEIAYAPISLCRDARLTARLLAYGEAQRARLADTAGKDEAALERLRLAVRVLSGRADDGVTPFAIRLIAEPGFKHENLPGIRASAAELLLEMESREGAEFLLSLQRQPKPDPLLVPYSFDAALKYWSPEAVYEAFEPYLKNKRSSLAKSLLHIVYDWTTTQERRLGIDEPEAESEAIAWDPRWVKLLVALDEAELVSRLATEPDRETILYLAEKAKAAGKRLDEQAALALLALRRLGYDQAPELVMQALEGAAAGKIYYLNRRWLLLIGEMPASYVERLEQFAEGLTYDSLKRDVLEAVGYARQNVAEATGKEKGAGWIQWLRNRLY